MYSSLTIQLTIISHHVINSASQFLPPYPISPVGGYPPIPVPMPAPVMIPPQQLPVVVMPYRSNAKRVRNKRRRRIITESSSSDSSDTSTSDSYSYDSSISDLTIERTRRKKALRNQRQVLTPVISYLNKKGRLVYQKKLKKKKAAEFLARKNNQPSTTMAKGKGFKKSRKKKNKHGHKHK